MTLTSLHDIHNLFFPSKNEIYVAFFGHWEVWLRNVGIIALCRDIFSHDPFGHADLQNDAEKTPSVSSLSEFLKEILSRIPVVL